MIPPVRFDISPLTAGCSEGLDAFRFLFKQQKWMPKKYTNLGRDIFNIPPPHLLANSLTLHEYLYQRLKLLLANRWQRDIFLFQHNEVCPSKIWNVPMSGLLERKTHIPCCSHVRFSSQVVSRTPWQRRRRRTPHQRNASGVPTQSNTGGGDHISTAPPPPNDHTLKTLTPAIGSIYSLITPRGDFGRRSQRFLRIFFHHTWVTSAAS